MAVGATIGAPTYGTYRLVKYIRGRRRNRPIRNRLPSMNVDENDVTNDDDNDDMVLAIQASLETGREEEARRQLERMIADISEEL